MPNPAVANRRFWNEARRLNAASGTAAMTVAGVAGKTLLLLLISLAGGMLSYAGLFVYGPLAAASPGVVWGGLVGMSLAGLVVSWLIFSKPERARTLGPVYAALQGMWLMLMTMSFEVTAYKGIGAMAALLTVGLFVLALTAFWARLIVPSRRFVTGVLLATGGIFLFYLASLLMRLLGVGTELLALAHGSGWFGIGFSLLVVAVATLNLVVDFGAIEDGVRAGAPKWMEWYGAFALLVTLVWLYIELLRLLAKLSRRR